MSEASKDAATQGEESRTKKPYKVVLEEVSQAKRPLKSLVTYSSRPPDSYTFVPTGVPAITEHCKEVARRKGLAVYAVCEVTNRSKETGDHVGRIGYHFPTEIVRDRLAQNQRQSRPTRTANISRGQARSSSLSNGVIARLGAIASLNLPPKEGARSMIQELFPKIPSSDLEDVISRAFEEGTNRVGNAKDMDLARRVQLAVIAHARHVHTPYDLLLKTETWERAREIVLPQVLDRMRKWRDEDQDDFAEIEEIFREVIILDDDEGLDGNQISQASALGQNSKRHRLGVNKTKRSVTQATQAHRSPSIEFVGEQPTACNDNMIVHDQPRREKAPSDLKQDEILGFDRSVYQTVETQPAANLSTGFKQRRGRKRRQALGSENEPPELSSPQTLTLAKRRMDRSCHRPSLSPPALTLEEHAMHPLHVSSNPLPHRSWPQINPQQDPVDRDVTTGDCNQAVPPTFVQNDVSTGGAFMSYSLQNPSHQLRHRLVLQQEIPQQIIWHDKSVPNRSHHLSSLPASDSMILPRHSFGGVSSTYNQNPWSSGSSESILTRSGRMYPHGSPS